MRRERAKVRRGDEPAGSAYLMLDNRAYVNQRMCACWVGAGLTHAEPEIHLDLAGNAWQWAAEGAAFEDDVPVAGLDALEHVEAVEGPAAAGPRRAEAHGRVFVIGRGQPDRETAVGCFGVAERAENRSPLSVRRRRCERLCRRGRGRRDQPAG